MTDTQHELLNLCEMSMMAFPCYILLFSVSLLTPWNFEITVLSLLDLLFYIHRLISCHWHTGDHNGEFPVEMIVPTLSIIVFYEYSYCLGGYFFNLIINISQKSFGSALLCMMTKWSEPVKNVWPNRKTSFYLGIYLHC